VFRVLDNALQRKARARVDLRDLGEIDDEGFDVVRRHDIAGDLEQLFAADIVRSYGGTVKVLKLVEGGLTSALVEKIRDL